MKSDKEVIQTLNAVLKAELTAINQFFLHSRIAKNWGLNNLATVQYKSSIDAMKTADGLIDRILFLEGLPNLQLLGKIVVGESVQEILNCDLWLATSVRGQLVESIELCESVRDYESRSIISAALDQTEEQIDWLESQNWLIESMGIKNYTQLQIEGEAQ